MKLRPYQTEAVQAVRDAWHRGVNRPAVVLPTGAGKTVCFSHLAGGLLEAGRRPLVLVHRDELAKQAAGKLRAILPAGTRVGTVKAEQNDITADVIVASVQTLSRPARMVQLTGVGAVICDEAHHATSVSYQNILKHFGSLPGPRFTGLPTVGFTATMMRSDKARLAETWQDIVYTRSIRYGIMHGFLTDVRGKSVQIEGLDLDKVARTAGDYQDQALADALQATFAAELVAEAYVEHAKDRLGVLFAPTVDSAYDFQRALIDAGITAGVVHAGTPIDERQALYAGHEAGRVQVLCNVGVLTEGWDSPATSCCVIARPTNSAGLYIQQVGRVLRPFPGKVDALVLDVVGASSKHSLATLGSLSVEAPVAVKDGQSLMEAVVESETKTAEEARIIREGRIQFGDVDLFRDRTSVWLRTPEGVWFVPAGDSLIFLYQQDDGLFSVGVLPNRGPVTGVTVVDRDLPLDFAMAVAEDHGNETGGTLASKSAAWRRGKASQAQIDYATTLGIPSPELLRRGDLSDAISVAKARGRLKRYAPTKEGN